MAKYDGEFFTTNAALSVVSGTAMMVSLKFKIQHACFQTEQAECCNQI